MNGKAYSRLVVGSAITVAALAAALLTASKRGESLSLAPLTTSPLGDTIPPVSLLAPDGSVVSLRAIALGHPTALYIYNVDECASCAGFELEFSILRKEIPDVVPLLVGTGESLEEFVPYFKKANVMSSAFVDEHGELLRRLRVPREPVVLLTDSSGRIVFVDTRSTSQAAQYPLGRVLHDLKATLALSTAARSVK